MIVSKPQKEISKQPKAERTDFGKVLVLAQSGYGKTYMFRNCDPETFGFINTERKPLPFKKVFKFHGKPISWNGFIQNLRDFADNPEIKTIGIDSQSMAFDLLYQECQKNFKGYDIFSTFNRRLVEYLDLLRDIEKDIIVTGHDEILLIEGFRQKRAKVHGKMYEGRIESYYAIVLYGEKEFKDNQARYFLKTMLPDTSTKVPPGMFDDPNFAIDNDAQMIFEALENYYS